MLHQDNNGPQQNKRQTTKGIYLFAVAEKKMKIRKRRTKQRHTCVYVSIYISLFSAQEQTLIRNERL